MKISLSITLLSLVSFLSFGQITINTSDLPSVGDEIYRNNAEKVDKSFFPGDDAVNGTWDVSWMTGKDPILAEFSDPADHPMKSSLGDANIIQHADPIDFFVRKDESGFNALGAIADPDAFPGKSVVMFEKPINFLPTPFTYKDESFSEGEVNFDYKSEAYSIDYFVDMSRDMEVINYGNLKMNDGKTYEVLMVDLYETRFTKSKITIGANDPAESTENEKTYFYEFYAKGYGVPLVRAERDSITDSIVRIEYVDFVTMVGVKNTSLTPQELTVYPNPSNGSFQIEIPESARSLELFNLSGQSIFTEAVLPGDQYQIDGLEAGVYVLRVYNRDGGLAAHTRLIAE